MPYQDTLRAKRQQAALDRKRQAELDAQIAELKRIQMATAAFQSKPSVVLTDQTDLERLNRQRNDFTLGPKTRLGADRAHTKINMHLKDKKYTSLRERLIRATIADDQEAIAKIELRIREHLGEDRFAASGAKDY